jgi:hypothetical protein
MNKVNDKKINDEILFLTRELRFAVSLIQVSLEETEYFDLIINDPSCMMFLFLSSQGVERLLKLTLSYNAILNDVHFSAKKYGHNIFNLYNDFKSIKKSSNITTIYKNLFEQKGLKSYLLNKFTDVLDYFNKQGRYYFTNKETRDKLGFSYSFDELFLEIIYKYQTLKIYDKNFGKLKYRQILEYAIKSASEIDSENYEIYLPEEFCKNADLSPSMPFWSEGFFGNEGATSKFKICAREFLLLYIYPIILMLEEQFELIMKKYDTPYYFNELTLYIKYTSKSYINKKHRRKERDIYSEVLL